MAHTHRISDGTTTIDFLGSNYKVLAAGGWSPKRAQLRPAGLANQLPYADVLETMSISISGTSEANVLDKLDDLSGLLEQVQAWREAPDLNSVVYLEYEPANANAGSVQAAIIGPPPGGDYLTLPTDFDFTITGGRYVLGHRDDPILLSFVRRGLLLGGTEVKSSTFSTGNPAIITTSLFNDDMAILTPYDLSVAFYENTVASWPTSGDQDIMILLANDADKLYLVEAESMTGASSTVVSGASAGSVHQQTDAGEVTLRDASFSMNSGSRLFSVYAVVKPSGTSTTWTFTTKLYYDFISGWSSPISEGPARPVTVGGSTDIEIVHLGLIATNFDPGELRVTITPDADNDETINVDYFAVIALDDSSRVIKTLAEYPGTAANFDEIKIRHRLDDHVDPVIEGYSSDVLYYYPTYNGPRLLTARGRSISALVFGGAPTFYVISNFTTELDFRLTATRTQAYLTPPGDWTSNIAVSDYMTIAESVAVGQVLYLSVTDTVLVHEGPTTEWTAEVEIV